MPPPAGRRRAAMNRSRDAAGCAGPGRGAGRLALVALLLGSPGTAATAAAQSGSSSPLPPASPGPPPQDAPPAAVPPLAPPGADEAGRLRAAAELRVAEAALRGAKAAHRKRASALAASQRKLSGARERITALAHEERRLVEELAAERGRVRALAVAGYVRGGDAMPVSYLLEARTPDDLVRRRSLVRSATEARQGIVRQYVAASESVGADLRATVVALEDAAAASRRAATEVAQAAAAVDRLQSDVAHRRQLLDLVTAAAAVLPSDIPRLFLDAYRRAAATLAQRVPLCRVGWPALAAIGKIESDHGRYRGALLALNGDVYPRILGVPLDGQRYRLIRDTDRGVFDLDTQFDRAVGPMQIIPSTWVRIRADGNSDGTSDPNNAYDSALGAARYLCRAVAPGGLDTDDGLRRAFFSYNHSEAYVETVLVWARTYRAVEAAGL